MRPVLRFRVSWGAAMSARLRWSPASWGILIVLACIWVGYLILVSGLPDEVLIARYRAKTLREIEIAGNSDPPNVEVLTAALSGPDWFASAVAAQRIGELSHSEKLKSNQREIAIRSLVAALASGGHWWRFGWDEDEPEFEQFRGEAIEATSSFGQEALAAVNSALNGTSPLGREAACWIVLSMLKSGAVDQAILTKQGVSESIRQVARNDPHEGAKAACRSVQNYSGQHN